MITLGLNAAFHDSAAVLVKDGVPLAAAEEERFTRIKHAKRPVPFAAWELPFHAIAWCLEHAGLTMADVDHVAYSLDPWRFAEGRADLPLDEATACLPVPIAPGPPGTRVRGPALEPWQSEWDPLFLALVLNAPGQLADGAPHHLKKRLMPAGVQPRWQWQFVDHHLCHQASAFLAAPYARCAVMTLDGRGERASTTYGRFDGERYGALGEVRVPHSLGLLYEQVTAHLGFLHSSDEYKVMALAAMGEPRFADALGEHLSLDGAGGYRIAPIDLARFVPRREPGSALGAPHFELAASLQVVLERTVLQLARWLREASGERHLAMAGGVALNCVMNAKLRDQGPFDGVWVQPAAGDAGTALGAALWVDATARGHAGALAPRAWTQTHAYLGPGWDDEAIEPLLQWAQLAYERHDSEDSLVARAAELLEDDRILGWFQGRMEWGPRALGARSILASPISPAMQQRLNGLKDREDFRPVAPAVLAEAFGDWFSPAEANDGRSPFMLFVHQVHPERAGRIPSACHSDGSARVQTVHAETNPRLHALIGAFARRTGVPVLVNTSFNVRGEPVVCTPKDALDAFFTTPLDALVIGRYVLTKPGCGIPERAARRVAE